ncbi:MAG: YceH family protein [Blastocatellia bacterium]
MDATLSASEVRVLGALIEKQLSTPDYYPLTLNALMNACNQLSNREPVVSYDEDTVLKSVDGLRKKGLARVITGPEMRVPKYAHNMEDLFNLAVQEIAVLGVLMLRGTQTVGEIRGRSGRLYEFTDLSEVELTLQGLMERKPQALVARLARQPGTKESRYSHLLAGDVVAEQKEVSVKEIVTVRSAEIISNNDNDERIEKLENEIQELKQQLAALAEQFQEFKRQFE